MKKYVLYILILATLAGLLGPTLKAQATITQAAPLGTCNIPNIDNTGKPVVDSSGKPVTQAYPNKVTSADCDQFLKGLTGGSWVVDSNGSIGPSITPGAQPVETLPSKQLVPNVTCNYPLVLKDNKCVPSLNSYILLAPIKGVNGEITNFDPTQKNALGAYLNLMIKIFIGLCAVMAVVMIVMGGIEYMTSELISSKEAGKERLTSAVLGLLIALGAFALLYTINPELLRTDLTSLTDATITVETDVPQTYNPTTKKYPNGATYGNKWDDSVCTPPTPCGLASLPSGVSVNTGECTTIGQQHCTSTRGLNLNYINKIQAYCSDCTSLVITGGTESWLHGGRTGSTSHMVGSPTVDLSPTPALTSYILSGTPQGNGRYLKDGISYLDERSSANHWHAGP